jgi:hypothetical protein
MIAFHKHVCVCISFWCQVQKTFPCVLSSKKGKKPIQLSVWNQFTKQVDLFCYQNPRILPVAVLSILFMCIHSCKPGSLFSLICISVNNINFHFLYYFYPHGILTNQINSLVFKWKCRSIYENQCEEVELTFPDYW